MEKSAHEEATSPNSQAASHDQQKSSPSSFHAPKNKFKFCYIIRGLPGTGKSTVAKQLAGQNGVILTLDAPTAHLQGTTDSSPASSHAKIDVDEVESMGSPAVIDEFTANQDKHFEDFCKELEQRTEIIVVDSTNIREQEYMHFIEKAQQEHYFTSIVTLPMNATIESASKRSQLQISPLQMEMMRQAFEPTSLEILSKKGNSMLHDSREFARNLEASPVGKLRVKQHADSFSNSAEKSATRRPSFKMEALQSIKAIEENNVNSESDEGEEHKA